MTDACGPDQGPGKILIVEDSQFFLNVISRRIESEIKAETLLAASLSQAMKQIEEHEEEISLCCIDLMLPDAPNGEIVDLVVEKKLPCIVFTGVYSDEIREEILSRKVIDYVTKDSPDSLDYLVGLIRRLTRNANTVAMVVDDSRSARQYVRDLLSLYRFNTIEACDGADALEKLEANPEIRLIITDYYMPKMDGFELIKRARKHRTRSDLAIIGLSSGGSGPMSARFIKYGANDFLNKPFLREEFFCRVSQNMDNIDLIRDLAIRASVDPLTGLSNRGVLFDMAPPLVAQARRSGQRSAVAVIDVDFFKKVNDTYGHDAGDKVLTGIAKILRTSFRRESDIVARLGGEEFCVVVPEAQADCVADQFDQLRADIAAARFDVGHGKSIGVTASIGVTSSQSSKFEDMLAVADHLLYDAKALGRDRVITENVQERSRVGVADPDGSDNFVGSRQITTKKCSGCI